MVLTDAKEYRVDDRLKQSLGAPGGDAALSSAITNPVPGVGTYDNTIAPVGTLELPKEKEKEEKKEEVAEKKIDPKEIMANDPEYRELNSTLASNAVRQKQHDPAPQKAGEAQSSAASPVNERMSLAQAKKVETLSEVGKPKEFKAQDLKQSILDEVEKILKKKKEEAHANGEKPFIDESDLNKVKEANKADITTQKAQSVGDIEKAHGQAPDTSKIEERKNEEVILENAGPVRKIPDTNKAVAKPIADERITLEKESAGIDQKMAANDVDDKQLADSQEPSFTGSLEQKQDAQDKAASVKPDFRKEETEKLDKDKQVAKGGINAGIHHIHATREGEFAKVDTVKNVTKSADEVKRKEIADKIEKLYSDAEKSVNEKLTSLEKSVNEEFDAIMATANANFKTNSNRALDDEFVWEWGAKVIDRPDFDKRVKKVFDEQTEKYRQELSTALNPLTNKIATTLNNIVAEIQAAKTAVTTFVKGLPTDLQEIGRQSAEGVMEKFKTLEQSVNEKQNALTNGLAQKYADGVKGLEAAFKEVMDSRKNFLDKAMDAIVDTINEIKNLLNDLKKALEKAADYGRRIIKEPLKFFNNLVKGASAGFNNFVKNIGKHLLQGALEWITGEMGEAGIQLPEKFDFKGILSIILQILGLTINNVKEIAKKVIGEKYVNMLEKGVDLGVKAADKILKIFTIVKKDGLAGLWEFIKEQFNDLKERLMEEAKSFIVTTIVEVAVVKVVSMLIPGAGFISAVKSLIDFLRTLFEKARQIVNIITGIIETFGEILAGNVSKVSTMVENILAKFLGMAITFLAAILGLGKIGKKINDIIQKKIKDPINKAITKIMEKLKALMTKLGIFKFLDKVEEKIKKGKQWVDEKKEKLKEKASDVLNKVKGFLKGIFNSYTDKNGETHTLKFTDTDVVRESITLNLGNYLLKVEKDIGQGNDADKAKHLKAVGEAKNWHKKIRDSIGKGVKMSQGQYEGGSDKYFSAGKGEEIRGYLQKIAEILRTLPADKVQNLIPKTVINYTPAKNGKSAVAPFITLDSKYAGSRASFDSELTLKIKDVVKQKTTKQAKLVRGHLINHELYGTGNESQNLAPITNTANTTMSATFEEKAKELMHSNNIISLSVNVDYGPPTDTVYGPSLLANKLGGEQIPTKINYNLQKLDFKSGVAATDEAVNNAKNWDKKSVKSGSIPNNHNEFF